MAGQTLHVDGGRAAPAGAAADPPAPPQDQDNGALSAITKALRSDKPLPEDQAPRPPLPVGQ